MRINLREKVFIPLCLALICLGAVMYFMTSIYLKRISTEFAAQIGRSKALEISAAMDAAGKNALGMASVFTKLQPVQRAYQIALSGEIDDENDPMVQQAREMLRNELMHHLLGYETVIGESVRIHFHLPNGRSLVRLWQKGNVQRDGQWVDGSDDLSATRSSVMEANLKRRVVQGLELGSDGFHLVSVLPLTSTRGEHMGSVEVEMDFGSILKGASASNGQHLMLYLNGEHAGAVPMLHNASKHPKIGDHFVQVSGANDRGVNSMVTPALLAKAKDNLSVLVDGSHTLTAFPLNDFGGRQVGVMVYALDASREQQLIRNIAWVLIGLLAAIMAAFAIIGQTTVWLTILKPMKQLLEFSKKVSGGDFQASITLKTGDEMEALAKAMNQMVVELRKKIAESDLKTRETAHAMEQAKNSTLEAEEARDEAELARKEGMLQAAGKIEEVVDNIAAAAEQLVQQIRKARDGSEQQKARTGEAAASMEEMNATVLEVAKNASQAALGSDQAKTRAQSGARIVHDAVKSIAAVQRNALELKKKISALGEKAEGIGKIMNVIDDIADQTNLLALNAAIEAARAGDAGRGFAVVADEVRKLAEKTMKATKEVSDYIGAIQDEVRQNASSVGETVESVKDATKLAANSGKELQEIVSLAESTSDQVRSIATAAEEQSAATEEITKSVDMIDRISTDTSRAMQSSAKSIEELSSQMRNLHLLVEELKEAD
jgi:methyl-accepting chemotaxis protein